MEVDRLPVSGGPRIITARAARTVTARLASSLAVPYRTVPHQPCNTPHFARAFPQVRHLIDSLHHKRQRQHAEEGEEGAEQQQREDRDADAGPQRQQQQQRQASGPAPLAGV